MTDRDIYAQPVDVSAPSECRFYHSTTLGEFGEVQGDWDLRGREAEYLGVSDLAGKRVLDVGTASGFLTFAAEEMGASEVVSFDADDIRRINLLPMVKDPIIQNLPGYFVSGADYLDRQKKSYWLTHKIRGSRAKAFYGDIYDLPPTLGRFDAVIVAQILVHLRDPTAALTAAASLSDDMLIIAEGMALDSEEPIARFLSAGASSPASIWWHLTPALYKALLSMLGFEIEKQSTSSYHCVSYNTDVPITTIVARRVAPAVPNPFIYTR